MICIVKFFLAERDHVRLCRRMLKVFPTLFKFEKCSVLFVASDDKKLFKIQLPSEEEEGQNKEFQNVVYFPMDMGCTGVAI